ncbi:predicted protein [Thalassiosira pseudonana CCMP1335]|uniref:Uncharacterized protein n=1 Tax=Thalassiosira pseudonana TaxID=35128 RepID=B8BT09_THAPS|nr:predicted protein [Thalassiosira pseudonana CCMP1335]EED96221.1 predicted protein [Thalassiosira pseudonana CCMP1335]
MSASSTIINNKKSPSTPLRQTYFASPAEANVANRTVLPGILHGPEYSRMKTAFKSHRVEFVDAKVFDERIERFVELERLRALPVPILKKYHSVRSTLLIEELDNLEKMYKAFRTSGAYRKRRHAYVLIDSPEEVLPTNPSALKRCRLTPTTLKRAIDDSGREERRSKRQRLGEAEAVSMATPAVVVAAAPPAVVPVATKRSIGDSGCEERRFKERRSKRQRLGEAEAAVAAPPAVVVAAAAPPAVVPVAINQDEASNKVAEQDRPVSTATPAVVVAAAAAAPPAVVPVAIKRAIGDSGCEERRSKRQRLGEAEAAVAAPPAVVVAAAAPPAVVPVAINQDEASNKVAEQERPVSTATPAVVVAAAAAAPPAVVLAAAAPPAVVPVAIKRAIGVSGCEERRSKRQRLGEAEAAVAAPPAVVVAAAAPPAVVPVAINQDEASNNVAEQERLAEDKKQRRKERELRRIESSLGPKWKVTVSSKSGLRRSSRVRKQTVFFRDLVW